MRFPLPLAIVAPSNIIRDHRSGMNRITTEWGWRGWNGVVKGKNEDENVNEFG